MTTPTDPASDVDYDPDTDTDDDYQPDTMKEDEGDIIADLPAAPGESEDFDGTITDDGDPGTATDDDPHGAGVPGTGE